MSLISYTLGIPDTPHNPSNDQPDMKINNDNIANYVAVDHVGFNTNGSGLHDQATMYLNQGSPGLHGGVGVYYTNSNPAGNPIGTAWPSFQNAIGSTYLLTQFPSANVNGYVGLPGGLIMQWGVVASTTSGTVTFLTSNIDFPAACFNVWTQPLYTGTAPSGDGGVAVKFPPSKTGFDWKFNTNSSGYSGFFWAAIGN